MIYLVSNQYNLYDSEFDKISISEAINILTPYVELALDTETKGLDPYTKELLLLQIGNSQFQIVFDIASFGGIIPPELVLFLNEPGRLYILQNAKFDVKFLFIQGIILLSVYDTMLVEIILTNGLQYSGRDLATLAFKYCGVTLDKSIRGRIIKYGLDEQVLRYGAKDIQHLHEIKKKQLEKAKELDLIKAIELDNNFVIPLAYTEFCGIKLDYTKWVHKTNKKIERALILKGKLEEQLWKDGKVKYFSGMQDMFTLNFDCILNWDSPKQVIQLFKEYGINVILRVKGVNKESIDAKVLEPQKDKFSILPLYLEYKGAQKDISTYGFNWKKYINPKTGRVHTSFQQLMNSGRLSSGNKNDDLPNIQNIPSDDETRACFISENNCSLIDADYSSQEQVVLANASREQNLLNFYKKGFTDMHSYVAFLMYPKIRRCTISELEPHSLDYIKEEHKDLRYLAKTAGFAINYGGNGSTIAKNCNLPKSEGEFVYKSYFESFPALRTYFDKGFEKVSKTGYIEFNPLTKRKYFFNVEANDYFTLRGEVEDKYFWMMSESPREMEGKYNKAKSEITRLSQNYPIQGTSADITKYAGILFFKEIISRGWFNIVKIVNIVHDEYLVECPDHLIKEATSVLITCMENAGKPFCTIVPLKADAKHGKHWVH
jgi:DNA polymerase-1